MIQTAQDVNGPGQSRLGPDYATGWGIVDAQAAADLLRLPAGSGIAQETLNNTGAANAYTHSFYVPAGEAEIHVTLAWTDPAGNPATPSGIQLVNDLDLRLIAPDDTVIAPWTLNPASPGNAAVRNGGDDTVNNVEQVSVLNPADGVWTAQVTAKAGSLTGGPQNFAIAGPFTPASGPIASTKADIMLVMDRSGSMILPSSTAGQNKLQALQSAASEFVDFIELVGGHQLGLLQFDTNVAPFLPAFDLQALDAASAPDARTAIGGMTIGDMTNIIDGVTQAQGQLNGLAAVNPEKTIFLFSDGKHNRPIGSNVADIDAVIDDDTRFYSIGFGTDVDSSIMPAVAANHDGLYFEEQSLSAGQLSK
ncbi:MAG: VWA domain-containing protein, partial [Gammaproteobacteria bacterium]|nr:VWA domain-containing protein [Gammaproteobacteria bacterium]